MKKILHSSINKLKAINCYHQTLTPMLNIDNIKLLVDLVIQL